MGQAALPFDLAAYYDPLPHTLYPLPMSMNAIGYRSTFGMNPEDWKLFIGYLPLPLRACVVGIVPIAVDRFDESDNSMADATVNAMSSMSCSGLGTSEGFRQAQTGVSFRN